MEQDLFEKWLQGHYQAVSLAGKLRQVAQWEALSGKALEACSFEDLLALVEARKAQYTPQALNARILALEQYLQALVEAGRLEKNVLAGFRVLAPPASAFTGGLSAEVLAEIYQQYPCQGHQGGQFAHDALRDKVMLGLVIFQALSRNCLQGLHTHHLDLGQGLLWVPQGRLQARRLPLEASQVILLAHYLQDSQPWLGPGATALFPCAQKTNLGVRLVAIAKKIRRYYPALQGLQQLRYSRIALWLKSQAPRWVQYQAGFADLQALHKFQQGRLEALQNAIERFHPF